MRFKTNVTVTFTKTNKAILGAFKRSCQEVLGVGYEPEITSGLEGTHSEESGHYHGRALDFHKHDIPVTLLPKILDLTSTYLGADYYLLNHETHIHIQRNKNTF